MLKLTSSKIDDDGNGFVEFHYEGCLDDCITVIGNTKKTPPACGGDELAKYFQKTLDKF